VTTIVEFHDSGCSVFHWESARGVHTLRASLRVPFAAPAPAPEETPATPATPTPAVPGPAAGAPLGDAAAHAANGAALRDALREAGLRVTEALAIVPKSWVTLRVVTLPSSDPTELAEMARFEAERHIPFNVERHIVAHRVMSVEGIEGARVLLAAMDGPVAEQVTATLSAAGIALTGIDVSTVALVNALRHSGLWMPEADPTVACVHIGADGSDIVVLHQGQIIFARSASLGAHRLALEEVAPEGAEGAPASGLTVVGAAVGAHAVVGAAVGAHAVTVVGAAVGAHAVTGAERLAREVRRTLDYAHREFECPPLARVFVSGLESEAAQAILERSLETPIEILDPFASAGSPGAGAEPSAASATAAGDTTASRPITFARSSVTARAPTSARALRVRRADHGPGLGEPGPTFAVGVGALLREFDPSALRVDLVPPAYDQARRKARRRQTWMIAGAAVLMLLAAGFLTTNRVLASRKHYLETLQTELNANHALEKEIKSRQSAVEILAKFTTVEGSALAVLDTVSQWQDLFGPAGQRRLSITDFQYTARRQVRITGYAAEYADLNDFMARMTDSDIFGEVGPPERTAMTEAPNNRGVKVLLFSLPCTLKGSEAAGKK
jgi:Tfp pilus assembly PilM family ATPase/Tfp pilus assembly protein PilN